ncbi:MAG TPA: AAA family ATPase, partial [Arachidicoccus sp.]
MKILGIRIKNLASLEGVTKIDFTQEPLSSAGIFAITGPTGAGKSTLLDALCLALYAKTPRYRLAENGIDITDVKGSTIKQDDVRGILRDGTSDGFAEVDFVGIDGQDYRANWSVRRARNKADGNIQAYEMTLKNISTNQDIPGKKTELLEEIERLVGLNFEQFTRSVLLAQGDFTAFLKAAKDEKSALLEKLTGTRIYSEISKQIFVNYSKEKRELEDLNLQREGIPTLTSEEVENLKQQKETLEQNITIQEKEAEALTKEIAWHTQLAVLQISVSTAHVTYEHSIEARQNAAGREQQLKQIEQVQSTRTWVDGQQAAEKQLAEKTAALQDLQTTLDSLQQQQEGLDKQLQTANETAAAAIQRQEAAVPHLEEARALDVQIGEKAAQVNLAATEVKAVEDTHQQLEQKLQKQQQQSGQLLASITQLQQWKADNNTRQPIAENHALISAKLGDAQALLDAAQSLLPELERTQTAIAEAKQAKAGLEATSGTIVQQLQAEKELHTAASEALADLPIATAEKEKAAIDSRIEDLIAAEAHWKIVSHSEAELNTLKQKLAENKSGLSNKTPLLAQASAQLVVAAAERDASLRMLDKARLAAAENVASLRSQLIPEEPCPVCGSTAHPYVTEQPQLNHVLAELQAAHQENDTAYATCLQTESSLQETIKRLTETIALQEQEISTKETALAVHQKTWEGFAIYPHTAEIPNEQKAAWLAQQLQDEKAQQKDLQQQIRWYAAKKQELDALQQKISDQERQQHENSNAVKDTGRRLQSLQEQESQYHKEQQNHNQALTTIEQSLSAYFTAPGWFTHWKNDAAAFGQRINEFAEQWKATIQKLEEDSLQHSVLTATLEATKGQLQNASLEVQKKQAALTAVAKQQDTLTQKRKAIFNGEAAATIEQGLKQAIAAAQQALEKIKSERELLQNNLTRTGTQQEQAEKNILLLQQQAETFHGKVRDWLSAFNSR